MEASQISINRQTDKNMWYIHTTEYYSAIKRSEILTHAATWMKHENIMLSEISPSQRDKYCMIYLTYIIIYGIENRQLHRDRK